ncbi:hypodermin-A-like [Ctenocephalides felis]|uniref:hypodermin-A-like n=1 Tax=Ctenocephalides felis TaxID=7515 RepID=UPI000E6E550B|nr:hypodermin-A-like [Ctenocephalides felis]
MFVQIVFLIIIAIGNCEKICEKMIGGHNAALGEFPHQVSIRYEGRHICGGAIIHNDYILTAAHCFDKNNPDKLTVVTGTINLTRGGEEHQIEKIIKHNFSEKTKENDIAVVKLQNSIKFNQFQKPIALPRKRPKGNTLSIVTGWGKHVYPGKAHPNNLQKMEVYTMTDEECRNVFGTQDTLCQE